MSDIQQALRLPLHEEAHDEGRSVSNDTNAVAITVGVTGTQSGCSVNQFNRLEQLLYKIYVLYSPYGSVWLSHGDCVGVDEETHYLAKPIGYKIRVHPPSNIKKRANCTGYDVMEMPQIYSIRNHDIVRVSDYMLVVPNQEIELVRSGTWATCRYARQRDKPHTIILPNGSLDGKNWQKIFKRR